MRLEVFAQKLKVTHLGLKAFVLIVNQKKGSGIMKLELYVCMKMQ